MEFFAKVWAAMDPYVILLIIMGGYFQRYYWKSETKIGKIFILPAWKTLIVGTLFVIIYTLITKYDGTFAPSYVKQAFLSYVFATSAYELILGPITHMIEKKFGVERADGEQPPPKP